MTREIKFDQELSINAGDLSILDFLGNTKITMSEKQKTEILRCLH